MAVVQHIEALRAKHAELDRQIDQENQRPIPDPTTLHSLKKEKLKLKDEIVRLED
ncbi:MAG: DUF465 domain-containing protein [Alphaproteobacteria bacterium]